MILRPFTESDWQFFSGCSSLTPMIAECDELTVVLDDCTVQAFVVDDVGDDGATYSFEFATPAAANHVASMIDGQVAARIWLRRL